MNLDRFKGLFPAQIVPFKEDNSINEVSLRRIIRRNLDKGVKGFYVCGSTGESFLMSHEERKNVLEIVKDEIAGKCTLIVHIGTISTDQTISLGLHAEKVGVDAISAVPPFYYRFSKEQIIAHYLDIVRSIDLPMIIYNIPHTSGVTFTLDDLRILFSEEKVIGIKHSSSDLFQMERLKNIGKEIVVLFGYDEMSLAAYTMGADGAIGSTYNLMPEKYLCMLKLFQEGDVSKALDIQIEVNKINEALLKVGIYAGIKYGISRSGIDCGIPRRPFRPLTDEDKRYLDRVLEQYL